MPVSCKIHELEIRVYPENIWEGSEWNEVLPFLINCAFVKSRYGTAKLYNIKLPVTCQVEKLRTAAAQGSK